MDMTISIDENFLNEVDKFVRNDKFTRFLLNNATDLDIPAFILTVLFTEIDNNRRKLEVLNHDSEKINN